MLIVLLSVEPRTQAANSRDTKKTADAFGLDVRDPQSREAVDAPINGSIKLHVLTTDETPIAGATLTASERTIPIGRESDEHGLIEMDVGECPSSGLCEIIATGFEPHTIRIQVLEQREYVVHLARSNCIRGVAINPTRSIYDPITVVAFPQGVRPTALELVTNPDIKLVLTDASGRFTFCGMEPNTWWSVVAGSPGYATAEPVLARVNQAKEMQLELRKYDAVALEFSQADGAQVCVSYALDSLEVGFQCVKRGGVFFDVRSAQALLSGVPLDWCSPRGDRHLVLCESPSDDKSEREMSCMSKLPGYEDTRYDVRFRPLTEGFVPVPLQLVRSRVQLSDAVVQISGLDSAERAYGTGLEAPLQLVLVPKHGGRALRFRIDNVSGGEHQIDCLPIGEYRVWMECIPGRRVGYPRESLVKVEDSSTARIEIDLSNTGAVEIQLLTSDGYPYVGPALLLIEDAQVSSESKSTMKARGRFIAFTSGPYRIPWLTPGEYRVWPGAPAPLEFMESESPRLVVVPNVEASASYVVQGTEGK